MNKKYLAMLGFCMLGLFVGQAHATCTGWTLGVTVVGSGVVETVLGGGCPEPVNCDPDGVEKDCSATYPNNQLVTLAVFPDLGHSFVSWSGCDKVDIRTHSCQVLMLHDRAVIAAFN